MRLDLDAVLAELIARRDAPARPGVNDPDLEPVPIESEMPLDLAHQPVHRGVGADRPAAAALTVCPVEAGLEPFLIGLPQEALEHPPLSDSELPQRLVLGHGPSLPIEGPGTRPL